MRRTLFKSKIHRATVTQADLDYEGSVTIDADADARGRHPAVREGSHLEPHQRQPAGDLRARGAGRLGRHLRQRRGRPPRAARRHGHHRDLRRGERRGRGARLEADGRPRRRAEPHRAMAAAASPTRSRARSGGCARSDRRRAFRVARRDAEEVHRRPPGRSVSALRARAGVQERGPARRGARGVRDADARSSRLHGGLPARGQRACSRSASATRRARSSSAASRPAGAAATGTR